MDGGVPLCSIYTFKFPSIDESTYFTPITRDVILNFHSGMRQFILHFVLSNLYSLKVLTFEACA